ncbi:helix-turn-helix domain-containing protein [Streptomyces sp. NPDC101151]|uniref:helix-turn-helix domain-containing protein n=1 Tax=Streptomyces sp. NPDC101151 TaxID=3366115 RepID=UPI0038292D74
MTNTTAERTLPVPEDLRPWITGIRALSGSASSEETFAHLPDAETKVVVRVGRGGHRDVLAVGPRVRAAYHDAGLPVSCVELRLAPGTSLPLLGVPAAELVGRVVPLDRLPGRAARRLAAQARWLDPEEGASRLADVLPELLSDTAGSSRTALLRAGVDALSVGSGRVPGQVRDVARELAVSERQLRNLFAEGVGVSPKHYARINRVRTVIDRATTAPWSELAAATGYYDQSHMTSDFRALMGVPPRSYFTGRRPAATACQAGRRP